MNWQKIGSTKFPGRFTVYKKGNIIYKKTNTNNNNTSNSFRKKITVDFNNYVSIMTNAWKHKCNHTVPIYDIERDGSHKSIYIDGFRLDKIGSNLNSIKNKKKRLEYASLVKKAVIKLKKSINENSNKMTGDWALHNLIYSTKYDKIYNIDVEGFYTYQKLPHWGNINHIHSWLDSVIKILS